MAAAGSVTRQLEEIEAALRRLPRPPTPLDAPHGVLSAAYAALLNVMRGVSSATDALEGPSGLHALSLHCPSLIPIVISDIAVSDEETAAQALKCLGFMVYHPALSSEIPGPVADQVVKALARLVVTTKMKAICNLGVWCISVQQLDASVLVPHFVYLLRAVIHALDNPFGSLSTTMEAMQAVKKLVTQLYEKMRETAAIWAPAVYRRLLSVDKKERDMSERCLLKIQSVLLPPSLTLSKAMAIDIRQKLLPSMVSMLHQHHEKVQIIKAWGWYIRLLGSYALRNRLLINELLKIPEKTFADPDPQVKIASLVSWEGLVDALLPSKMVALEMSVDCVAQEDCLKTVHAPSATIGDPEIQIDGLLKRVKLIMVPLQGFLSSTCDISVCSTGLNTWCYLLHKINSFITHSSIRSIVLEPVLGIVFSKGPFDRNIWLWNSCLDLFDEFVSSKVKSGNKSPKDLNLCHLLLKESSYGPSAEGKCLWKDYPSWELDDLSFVIKIIDIIVHQGAVTVISPKSKILALSAALRIFRSVLKGIQAEFRKLATSYTEIRFCINIVLTFVKDVFKDTTLGPKGAMNLDVLACALHFLEAVKEELEPSILASSLYSVALDVKYICEFESGRDSEHLEILGIIPIVYMDMVSPLVYLEILYLSEIAQSLVDFSESSIFLQKIPILDFVFFSFNPMISLHAFICFLYMHFKKSSNLSICLLSLWRIVAVRLKEYIEAVNGLTFLSSETDNAGHILMYWFLCYPLVCIMSMEFSSPENTNSNFYLVYPEKQLELDSVIELWQLLLHMSNYATALESSAVNSFLEGLSELLIEVLDFHERNCATSSSTGKTLNTVVLSLHGEAVSYMMREIQIVHYTTLASPVGNNEVSKCKQTSNLKNSLVLVSRFLLLLLEAVKTNPTTEIPCVLRIFDALSHMVGKVCLKTDILFLTKVLSDALGHWLSSCSLLCTETHQEQILSHLHLCWKQLLDCFLRSQPPILFDSSFLEVQAPLLKSALDNQYSPISNTTLEFWKATYGNQTNLSYPQILLPVLDKLSRSGLIELKKDTHAFLKGCNVLVDKTMEVPQRFAVSIISKITEQVQNDSDPPDDSLMHGQKKRMRVHECSTSGHECCL